MDSKDKNEFIEREGNAGVVKEEEEEENEEDEDYELELGSREESMDEILMGKQQLQGEMRKYWRQRHNLFTKYDNGCLMTRELWFSVTPELISERMAEIIQQEYDLELGENTSVLDMFCGGGGDSISFLKRGWRVLACDNNETHLNCTRHNAQIYGVDRHLETFLVDWTGSESAEYKLFHSMISIKKVDFVFGSPPCMGGVPHTKTTRPSLQRETSFPSLYTSCCSSPSSSPIRLPSFSHVILQSMNLSLLVKTSSPEPRWIYVLCISHWPAIARVCWLFGQYMVV